MTRAQKALLFRSYELVEKKTRLAILISQRGRASEEAQLAKQELEAAEASFAVALDEAIYLGIGRNLGGGWYEVGSARFTFRCPSRQK